MGEAHSLSAERAIARSHRLTQRQRINSCRSAADEIDIIKRHRSAAAVDCDVQVHHGRTSITLEDAAPGRGARGRDSRGNRPAIESDVAGTARRSRESGRTERDTHE